MKNKVLFALFVFLVSVNFSKAQITLPNYSFENWALDTNDLNLNEGGANIFDTTINSDPTGWSTSNKITNGAVFHHHTLVTESSSYYVGLHSVQLTNDSLSATISTSFGTLTPAFVCPGFIVSGVFPINFSAFANPALQGTPFNPALLPGAGVPVSARYSKIGGYLKYSPVGGDSAYVIAVLRQGSTIVATATYIRSDTDSRFTYFEAPFVYQSCLVPDTLVYTISSSDPYSISKVLLNQPSGLHLGSTLLADSVFVGDTLAGGDVVIAVNDVAQTIVNTAVSIPVTANDQTCGSGTFVIAQSVAPKHGTITITGDSIAYTPANNFTGIDTFTYSESVGGGPSATALVFVTVSCGPATPKKDSAHTVLNTPVTILVTVNDSSTCATGAYVISQDTAPMHGSITIIDSAVVYTPDSGYVGLDTFYYSETIGGGSPGIAEVIVTVTYHTGIIPVAESKTSIYPNPASTKLYVANPNPAISALRICDMLGKVMKEENFSFNTSVDVSGFSNGIYIIQFSGSDGKMVSSSRFIVVK